MNERGMVVGGTERAAAKTFEVVNPWNGEIVARVADAGHEAIEEALEAAVAGFREARAIPSWRRAEILHRAAARVAEDTEPLARLIALEAGKPIRQARAEVGRAVLTLRTSAEEAVRIGGEVVPLDLTPDAEGRFGIVRRFPVGPVTCVTPFNFPLNLVAHKVAPALAAGCSFVLKPASRTPLSALALAAILVESGAPPAAVSVLPLRGAAAEPLVEDPRTRAVSFTGSGDVGWALRRLAGRKRVVLELGGNAGVIVDRSADLELACDRIALGGFAHAGQSCVSVQRVFVHESVARRFVEMLVDRVRSLVVGDPLDEETVVGPMIDEAEASRIVAWIAEAVSGGAHLLTGGRRDGALVTPTILTGTDRAMKVRAREAFAPLVVVETVTDLDEAIRRVDDSDFGLQAGIFTDDLPAALAAYERIEAGAVLVNEVPTWRSDPMPYGGVKGSGIGREGPRWAIEDYTEPRLLVLARGRSGQ